MGHSKHTNGKKIRVKIGEEIELVIEQVVVGSLQAQKSQLFIDHIETVCRAIRFNDAHRFRVVSRRKNDSKKCTTNAQAHTHPTQIKECKRRHT